jgi:hypothetical protein
MKNLTKVLGEGSEAVVLFSVNYSTDKLLLKEVLIKDGRDWGPTWKNIL